MSNELWSMKGECLPGGDKIEAREVMPECGPSVPAWKAGTLPLSYSRESLIILMDMAPAVKAL